MKCFDTDGEDTPSMQRFQDIVAKLRSEQGCPWDRVQTHQSLRHCIIDEAAEVLAAVDLYEKLGDAENLCEELGDLLFLIVLQSQIAEEEGIFTFEDVVEGITKKMIRRHPHIFRRGQEKIPSWEEIKRQEKSEKDPSFFIEQKKALKKNQSEMADYLKSETEKTE